MITKRYGNMITNAHRVVAAKRETRSSTATKRKASSAFGGLSDSSDSSDTSNESITNAANPSLLFSVSHRKKRRSSPQDDMPGLSPGSQASSVTMTDSPVLTATSNNSTVFSFTSPNSGSLSASDDETYMQTGLNITLTPSSLKAPSSPHKSLFRFGRSNVHTSMLSNTITLFPGHFALPIPELPVLRAIQERVELRDDKPDLSKIIFVCGQHLLDTTASLFKMLIKLGANPNNMFVIGKSYSNNHQVSQALLSLGVKVFQNTMRHPLGKFKDQYESDIRNMWADVKNHISTNYEAQSLELNGIIVLDDGGHVLDCTAAAEFAPYIIGIEQTSSGLTFTNSMLFPVIQVASSAVKNWIEPPMVTAKITEKMISKLNDITSDERYKMSDAGIIYGVIGFGNIGKAMVERLKNELGYQKIYIYDSNPDRISEANKLYQNNPKIKVKEKLSLVAAAADIIIGCTGTDVFAAEPNILDTQRQTKILVSCSSKDTEFKTLLIAQQPNFRQQQHPDPLQTVFYLNET
jgi:S-adenosylhomocysteine hydrolase